VVFKEKTYLQAQGRFEWGEWKGTRVRFSIQSGQAIFKEPLLLVSNLEVKGMLLAQLIFEFYRHRAKIESVFRFLKQVLGWTVRRCGALLSQRLGDDKEPDCFWLLCWWLFL